MNLCFQCVCRLWTRSLSCAETSFEAPGLHMFLPIGHVSKDSLLLKLNGNGRMTEKGRRLPFGAWPSVSEVAVKRSRWKDLLRVVILLLSVWRHVFLPLPFHSGGKVSALKVCLCYLGCFLSQSTCSPSCLLHMCHVLLDSHRCVITGACRGCSGANGPWYKWNNHLLLYNKCFIYRNIITSGSSELFLISFFSV